MSAMPASSTIEWLYNHSSLWDVAGAMVGLFVVSCMRERLNNKGPMLWPVLGIIPSVFLHMDNMYDWATEALIRSDGTFSYRGMWMGGAHGIITTDPLNIEYVVKTKFKNFPKGSYYRERFHDLLGDGIFNADGDLWEDQRRLARSEMHSSRFLEHSLKVMHKLVHKKLLRLTENFVDSGTIFDMQGILLRFTFDNICVSALGVDPGCLALDLPDIPFAKAFEEATELTMFRFMVPPFLWKPLKFLRMGHEKRLGEAIEIVHDFARKVVEDRRNRLRELRKLNDKSDLLSKFMENQSKEQDKFFVDFCVSFVLAGRDTTSVALAWFFWLVHKNPEVESKIVGEIQEILRQRGAKTENSSAYTAVELKNMVYLQAALSESLRLYPPVPMEMKQVLEDDVLSDGHVVKRGAKVLFCIFAMARMEAIWGKDCLEYRPERWLKDGEFVSENQFKYAVFNGGPRLCLGKKFAFMQMEMVAASILLRYSVQVVENQEIVPKLTTTLYMKNGLMVRLKPRHL